jgi:nucleoside-diphosphate-sugar epimerase
VHCTTSTLETYIDIGAYDQREHFLVPKIVSHFRRRAQTIEFGNIDVVREFIDVPTVVEVYFRLLGCRNAVGDTVNICSCRGIALRDLVALLEAETGHRMEIRVDPEFVRANGVRRLVGSTAKLQSLIGAVTEIPLAATLRDMLAGA